MIRIEFWPFARAGASMLAQYLTECAGFACGVAVGAVTEIWRRAWER